MKLHAYMRQEVKTWFLMTRNRPASPLVRSKRAAAGLQNHLFVEGPLHPVAPDDGPDVLLGPVLRRRQVEDQHAAVRELDLPPLGDASYPRRCLVSMPSEH